MLMFFPGSREILAINLVGAVQLAILWIQVTAVAREHLPEPWAKQWNEQNGGFRSMLFSSCYSQYRGQREQAGCFRLALFGNANVRRAKLLNLTWDLGAVEWHWERSYISKTNGDYVLKSWSVPRPKLFTSYCSAIVRNISRKLRA